MNTEFAHIFRLIPAKYLTRAIIAGGAAACYEKADDIDIWVLGLNDDKKVEEFVTDLKAANISGIEFVTPNEAIEKAVDSGANFNNQVVANIPNGIEFNAGPFYTHTRPVQIMASVFMTPANLLEDFDLSTHAIGYDCVGSIFKAAYWTDLTQSPLLIGNPKSPDRTLSRYRRFCLRYGLQPDMITLQRLCTMPDPQCQIQTAMTESELHELLELGSKTRTSAQEYASTRDTMPKNAVPVSRSKLGEFICEFEQEMARKLVGQPDAVKAITQALKLHLSKMQAPGRPISNLLFLGPTGSGKTRSIEVATEILYPNLKDAFVKINCAEFQRSHEIAKLIGSPPGYIGHRETSPALSQEVLDKFHSDKLKITFVLFDEIEKASDALWQLLLGIMDKATLTTGDTRKVDFSNCVIILTSNLGADAMSKLANEKMGFAPASLNVDSKLSSVALMAAKKRFSPEFMNRIDACVVFKSLQAADLRIILDLELRAVQERILHAECPAFILEWTAAACKFLIAEGTSKEYGARELKRTIEKHVVTGLIDVLLGSGVDNADTLTIDIGASGDLIFHYTPR